MKRFLTQTCKGMALPCPPIAKTTQILLILLCSWLISPTVLAHSELVTSSPAPGETVGADLKEIRLEFSEPVSPESQILLFTADFTPVTRLTTYHETLYPNRIYAPISNLRTGKYIVQWTAVSQDGHQTEGSYQFRVINLSYLIYPTNLLLLFSLLLLGIIIFFWRRKNRNGRISE